MPTFRVRPWVPRILLLPSRGWAGAALGPEVTPGQQPGQQHGLNGTNEEQQQQDGEVVNWEGAGVMVRASSAQVAEQRWGATLPPRQRSCPGPGPPGRGGEGRGGAGRGLLSSGLQEEELGRACTREEWKTR